MVTKGVGHKLDSLEEDNDPDEDEERVKYNDKKILTDRFLCNDFRNFSYRIMRKKKLMEASLLQNSSIILQ